ncbi:DUF4913 domain-containing protein [Streptomyces sp. FH025]|nr:DUF4913 domain-containing protein [Streptomyces sp. FH025]
MTPAIKDNLRYDAVPWTRFDHVRAPARTLPVLLEEIRLGDTGTADQALHTLWARTWQEDSPFATGALAVPFLIRIALAHPRQPADLLRLVGAVARLRLLAEWVEGVLVPGCLGEVSADARWCHRWIEHGDTVGVLHAMWLAWQELTDPATCGYTGPSVWYRDHYRPHIADLRGPAGPFAGCTKGEHRTGHRLPGRVPSVWYMDGYTDGEGSAD